MIPLKRSRSGRHVSASDNGRSLPWEANSSDFTSELARVFWKEHDVQKGRLQWKWKHVCRHRSRSTIRFILSMITSFWEIQLWNSIKYLFCGKRQLFINRLSNIMGGIVVLFKVTVREKPMSLWRGTSQPMTPASWEGRDQFREVKINPRAPRVPALVYA